MRHILLLPLLAGLAAPALAQSGVTAPPPAQAAQPTAKDRPAFSNLTFDQARAANEKDGKILFVKGTADWCQPCKIMDATTFRDPRILEWLKSSGTLIDVDTDLEPKLGQALRIRVMPTLVVFKDGKEIDRAIGMLQPDTFHAWQKRLGSGQTNMSIIADRITKQQAAPQDRLVYLDHLMGSGQLEAAVAEATWLWENLPASNPQIAGMRQQIVVPAWAEIAKNEALKPRVAEVRDRAEAKVKAEPRGVYTLEDWLILNEALGDDARVLAWFDEAKAKPEQLAAAEQLWYRVDPVLARAQRWTDVALLCRDPATRAQQSYQMVHVARQRGTEADVAKAAELYTAEVAKLYVSMLAANRPSDAAKLTDVVLKVDTAGDAALALVDRALEAGQPREEQHALLKFAKDKGQHTDDLTQKLASALARKP